jgi:nicotinate-nucleotide adenylyltransferase
VWAADNPFKIDQTPLLHRQAMLTALVQGMDPPAASVRVYPELSHRYTIATVGLARDRWPDHPLVLAVGSDLVEQLPQWYRAAELLAQVSLVVVPRPGYAIAPAALDRLRHRGTPVTVAALEGLDVSSSAYRRERDSATLPPAVTAYIRHHQLYPD